MMDFCGPRRALCAQKSTKVSETNGKHKQRQVKSDSQSSCHTGHFGLLLHSTILPLSSQTSLSSKNQTLGNLLVVPGLKTINNRLWLFQRRQKGEEPRISFDPNIIYVSYFIGSFKSYLSIHTRVRTVVVLSWDECRCFYFSCLFILGEHQLIL